MNIWILVQEDCRVRGSGPGLLCVACCAWLLGLFPVPIQIVLLSVMCLF